MTFYLKPPRGIINFHILEKCVEQRLQFFRSNCDDTKTDFEYLLDDSAFDRTGHFILRLAAYKNFSFRPYFIENEVKLFRKRLLSYDYDKIRTFLRTLLRHSQEFKKSRKMSDNEILTVLIYVCTRMLSKNYGQHVFNKKHTNCDKCSCFTLYVRFQHCLPLIVNYEVNLKKGYVQITCMKWKELLVSLYETHLKQTLQEMNNDNIELALNDSRIQYVIDSISENKNVGSKSQISLVQIDSENRHFPLCMQNLHETLRKNHRLQHEARYDLSLFLKDIGMSLDDSFQYWKTEYSKEPANCPSCSHNWQLNEKKFVYGIRHLYGLEGSRKNYETRSCSHFQERMLGATEEGGCPFKHFDNKQLHGLLSTRIEASQIDDIIRERGNNAHRACRKFLAMHNLNNSHSIQFENPAQYFILMKQVLR